MEKDKQPTVTEHEWSHFIDSDKIDREKRVIELSPPEESVRRLCQRLNLISIPHLSAELTIQRLDINKVVHIMGKIIADVEQACVVTGDSVPEHVEDEFEAWYAEPNQAVSFTKAKRERMKPKEKDDQPMLEEEDDPEAIIDGKIDAGELVVQYLSLALNPYPRKEGVRSNFGEPLEEAPEGTYNNPFAALKDWKAREKNKDQ